MEEGVAGLEMPPKCSRRGCRDLLTPPLPCAAASCNKRIHHLCFYNIFLKEKELEPLPNNQVACTKKCYDKVKSAGTKRATWNNDGKDGPDDHNTSERILIDWLLEAGNYDKYRGHKNGGTKKQQFAKMLADKMNAAGVVVKRDAKQVLAKITHLETSWKKAHNFATKETGAGLKADDPDSFEEKVQGICANCFDLFDIMNGKPNSQLMSCSWSLPLMRKN